MLSIEIAGARFDCELAGFTCEPALRERYASFLAAGPSPDALRVHLTATAKRPEAIGDFRIVAGPPARLAREDIAVAEGADGVFAGTVEDEPFSFDMALRGLLNLAAARRGLLMVHSLGTLSGGTAAVFPGLESAGKSTLGRLRRAAGETILSDEIMVLRPGAGPVEAAGTPFMGELPGPRPAGFFPLRELDLLSGWGRDAALPLDRRAALPRFLRQVINYAPGTALSEAFFATAVRVIAGTSPRAFYFTRGGRPPGAPHDRSGADKGDGS